MKILSKQIQFFFLSLILVSLASCSTTPNSPRHPSSSDASAPSPLLKSGTPVNWWFVFKMNSAAFPSCDGNNVRHCLFGGSVQNYNAFGQQFVYASSHDPKLQKGVGCCGDELSDPIGATFDQIYNGKLFYVVWNDQMYDDPKMTGCSGSCNAPWGHSKGVVAWDENGDGVIMQVSTPSWPASGSAKFPRKTDGNTLGCVKDNDIDVSQHFFSLKINKDDLVIILKSLANSSVATAPGDKQLVNNGGPSDVQELVSALGVHSKSNSFLKNQLSSGVILISKPSDLAVPPWQMVSAVLGGVSIRTANWWTLPEIESTTSTTEIKCWDQSLGRAGAVDIATTGTWNGVKFGLTGGIGNNYNHAKIGVTTSGGHPYAIFGDMNQQGTLNGPACDSSQNGRGGMFFALENAELSSSIANLIAGDSAPTSPIHSGTGSPVKKPTTKK